MKSLQLPHTHGAEVETNGAEGGTKGAEVGKWFVVYVEPSHEQISATLLTESGYEIFVPTYKKIVRWSNTKKQIELPLFSRYLFCRIRPNITAKVIGTPGVVKLIGFREGEGAIEDEEIKRLRILISHDASPYIGLAVGDRVRIRSGALDGVEGILLSRNGEATLVVSVDALQRSLAVRVNGEVVERVGKP